MITPQWVARQFPELSSITTYPAGGQKWVFGATHPSDGDVVLKVIKPTTSLERVQREVLAVKQVNSPRVPRIFADGVVHEPTIGTDLIWLREQLVQGENVRQFLGRGLLVRDEILRLGLHVLEALADVAQARIVHRDVKPDNVMRCSDGTYWLLDFGIARHLTLSSLTATAALGGPGTVGYAPPEQFRNKKRELDGRADLFALSVTLVECMTGRHPYRNGARDAAEVNRRIETMPMSVPSIPWDVGRKMSDLLVSMGQRRADCRPPDATEALVWMKEIHADHGL